MMCFFRRVIAVAALATALSVQQAQAGFIVSVPTQNVTQGESGSFNVTLTNTGPDAIELGGFSVRIDLLNSMTGVHFTDVVQPTSGYVFEGQGANSLGFTPVGYLDSSTTTPLPGSAVGVATSDILLFDPSSITIASGSSYTLMTVSYQISPGTPDGMVGIAFDRSVSTAFNDAGNVDLTFQDGGLNINNGTPAIATPEPSALLQAGLGSFGLCLAYWRRWFGMRLVGRRSRASALNIPV